MINDKLRKQEDIINELFKSVTTNRPKNEAFINIYIFKKLEEIFEIEVNFLGLTYSKKSKKNNEVEFKTLPKKDDTTAGGFRYTGKIPTIIMFSTPENNSDILSSDPKRRLNGIKQYLKTLFHELRHLKQYLLTQQSVSNKYALRNAKEFLFAIYLEAEMTKLYKTQHNNFAIEADALRESNLEVDYFSKSESNDSISIYESNRDVSQIIVGNEVHNRDEFISDKINSAINEEGKTEFFKLMPILLKEYNEDGSKKTISVLVENMKKEIKDASIIKDEETKNQVITDIKEFYYELIYNRLEKKDYFELYDAIKKHGQDEILNLCYNNQSYIRVEKRKAFKLLDRKFPVEKQKEKDTTTYPLYNNGMIKMNTLNGTELITREEFIESLGYPDNEILQILYKSEVFKQRIPDYGIYILNDGTRMNVKSFLKNVFLPERERMGKKSNITLVFTKILQKFVRSPKEIEDLYEHDNVNASFQRKNQNIIDIVNSDLISCSYPFYDNNTYELMKIVKYIDNPQVSISLYNYMLSNSTDDEYYFDENQVNYFNNLLDVAKSLNKDTLLNPNGVDYYKNFKNNGAVGIIKKLIERYYKKGYDPNNVIVK